MIRRSPTGFKTLVSSAKSNHCIRTISVSALTTSRLIGSSISPNITVSSLRTYPATFSARSSSISAAKMASSVPTKAQIAEVFSPAALSSVRVFWFHGLSESDLILPPMSVAPRWFQRNEEFDKACYSNFSAQISLLKSPEVTISSLIDAISENYKGEPVPPLDWLSLIILLDQIPRNVFRDADAQIVFTVTDPKALELAHYVLANNIPQQVPVGYRLAYRFWFCLPLEHSEDPNVQVESVTEHEKMFKDLNALITRDEEEIAALDEDTRRCYEVIKERKDILKTWESALMEKYVLGHKRIIDRFGRYPHRNEVLGRASTEEEIEYLTGGGETFGGKRAE
ncbi:Bacterial protein of unknown function (DUF924) domain containing protein [Naviculisporaceae sp. PSN 640]